MESQVVGRLGELWVELKLLQLGWQVGNFNQATRNNRAFDLFATKGLLTRKLRVKAARQGDPIWSRGEPSSPLPSLIAGDRSDFSIIVLYVCEEKPHFYIVPSHVLAQHLLNVYELYMKNPGVRVATRKDPGRWWLFFEGRADTPDQDRGYDERWKEYKDAWPLLEVG
jgi:hypothetical protein